MWLSCLESKIKSSEKNVIFYEEIKIVNCRSVMMSL